jgi:hypothetical protein
VGRSFERRWYGNRTLRAHSLADNVLVSLIRSPPRSCSLRRMRIGPAWSSRTTFSSKHIVQLPQEGANEQRAILRGPAEVRRRRGRGSRSRDRGARPRRPYRGRQRYL